MIWALIILGPLVVILGLVWLGVIIGELRDRIRALEFHVKGLDASFDAAFKRETQVGVSLSSLARELGFKRRDPAVYTSQWERSSGSEGL